MCCLFCHAPYLHLFFSNLESQETRGGRTECSGWGLVGINQHPPTFQGVFNLCNYNCVYYLYDSKLKKSSIYNTDLVYYMSSLRSYFHRLTNQLLMYSQCVQPTRPIVINYTFMMHNKWTRVPESHCSCSSPLIVALVAPGHCPLLLWDWRPWWNCYKSASTWCA